MIGLLVVTHGRLGEALLETAAMISGGTQGARAIGFLPGQGVEDLEAAVTAALGELDAPDGTLCLLDLPGGSPARVVGGLLAQREGLEAVTGVNLPMLVEVLFLRDSMGVRELARVARDAGCMGVVDVGDLLRSELSREEA
ncbi:MAG: PTS sugar transporter subunit IIA [Mycobacterium leprae]